MRSMVERSDGGEQMRRASARLGKAFLVLWACVGTDALAQQFNYAEAMQKSFFFYKAQRAGVLPLDNPVPWRGSTVPDDVVRDSAGSIVVDLRNGYFDAGDHVKYNLPMTAAVTTLGWGLYKYGSALPTSLRAEALETIRWATDYLIKAHPSANEYYFQVGRGSGGTKQNPDDHDVWVPAEVIHVKTWRPIYKADLSNRASTAAAEAASALAVAYLLFKSSDPTYANTCLTHAKQLFTYAWNNGSPSDAYYDSAAPEYKSYNGPWDEISAAGAWLYLATGDYNSYIPIADAASANWEKECRSCTIWRYTWAHSWSDKQFMAALLLADITQDAAQRKLYVEHVNRNLNWLIPEANPTNPGDPSYVSAHVKYTPGGLAYIDPNGWGILRYAANAAFLAFVWTESPSADPTKAGIYRGFAERQINYALGANPFNNPDGSVGRSYLIGFGANPPKNPHHRGAHGVWNGVNFANSAPATSQHILYGGLVGGPDSKDAYVDNRADYKMNEVALDYNAGFTAALMKMRQLHPTSGEPLSSFPGHADHTSQQVYLKDHSGMLVEQPDFFARAYVVSNDATKSVIMTQTANRSAWPAAVRENMSFRYFFDISEIIAAGGSISNVYAKLLTTEGGSLSGPFHHGGSVYYVEGRFPGIKIYPGHGSADCERELKLEVGTTLTGKWNASNDWSFANLPGTYSSEPIDLTGLTSRIPVYEAGVQLETDFGREPYSSTMHVYSIDMDKQATSTRKGTSYTATAEILVVDASSRPIQGVTVSVSWTGAASGSGSGVTNSVGKVVLTSPSTTKTGTITCTVSSLSAHSFTYQPSSNLETSDSVTVP
jgi:endoglucanase